MLSASLSLDSLVLGRVTEAAPWVLWSFGREAVHSLDGSAVLAWELWAREPLSQEPRTQERLAQERLTRAPLAQEPRAQEPLAQEPRAQERRAQGSLAQWA